MAVLSQKEAGIALGTQEGNIEVMSLNDRFKSCGKNFVEEVQRNGKKLFEEKKHLLDSKLSRFLTPTTSSRTTTTAYSSPQ